MRTIILRIETEELCDQIEAALAAAGLAAVYKGRSIYDNYVIETIPEHLKAKTS